MSTVPLQNVRVDAADVENSCWSPWSSACLPQLLITANSLQKSSTRRFPTFPVWKSEAALAPAGPPRCFIHADELFQRAVISSTLSAGAADRWDPLLQRPCRTPPPERLSLPAAGGGGAGGGENA